MPNEEKKNNGIPSAGEFLYGYVNNQFEAYIKNNTEQICAFIMKNKFADTKITNFLDELLIETVFGSFIMYCMDQKFLESELKPMLIPMQTGTADIIEFVPYEPDESDEEDEDE